MDDVCLLMTGLTDSMTFVYILLLRDYSVRSMEYC